LPLARAGFDVTGVDLSPRMLEVAQAKVDAAGLNDSITLVQADMRQVELPQQYRLAFIAINSFMHLLTLEDQLAALSAWRRLLLPGGMLIIDVDHQDPRHLLEADGRLDLHGRWFDPDSGATVLKHMARTLDAARQLQHVLFIYDEVFPDGQMRRTLAPFQARYLYRFEGELLLPGGLLIIDVYNPNPQGLLEADGRIDLNGRWFDPATGAVVLKQTSRTLDDARQLQHVMFIYDEVFPDGQMRRTLAPFQARYVYRFEGELLLDKAGFTPEQVFGSYDLDPYSSESERMIFVARRAER